MKSWVGAALLLVMLSLPAAAVEFEKVPSRTPLRPGIRIKAASAYCKTLDIFVMIGGYFNVGDRSYLPGDFWLYSFPNASWTDLGSRYSQLGLSPGQQFGGTLTHVESVTSHCQFLVHGGKTNDPCRSNHFANTYLVDVRISEGQYVVSEKLLKVPLSAQAFAQEGVYYNNSVYFVGGTPRCRFSRSRKKAYYVLRSGLFRYDVAADSWERMEINGPNPTQRLEHMFALYDKQGDPQLLLHGGHNNQRYLNDIWSFSLTSMTWTRLKESGPKIATSVADMHVVGNLVYIFGGWVAPSSGGAFKSASVLLTSLGDNNDYGCVVQGQGNSWCEMRLSNSIGTRLYYVSAVRQNKLIIFGGVPVVDSELYSLNLSKPEVETIVRNSEEDNFSMAMLHYALVVGISVCLFVTLVAVMQRVVLRRRFATSQNASGGEANQPASAGVSESVLKALPIIIYQRKPATSGVVKLEDQGSKDDSGDIELAILDIEKGDISPAKESHASKDSMDASSSSEASTEASSQSKSPRGRINEELIEDAGEYTKENANETAGASNTTNTCGQKPADQLEAFGDMCAICICDYSVGDELRMLPCNHAFHSSCVDTWLKLSTACPMCKQDIVDPDRV